MQPITKDLMSQYYDRIYPTDLVAQWLRYGGEGNLMARREFCFTLIGDIFTRFRSYANEAALRADLVKQGPEKIDIGAIYDTTPDKKATVQLTPQERELVFDIDMSDYDTVRSCCSGKQVCASCWTWMSAAAHILRDLMTCDMGFQLLMPVFSGRRGIHIWVLDPEARTLTDEERSGVVGYCTVVKEASINILAELRRGALHPSMERVHESILVPYFDKIFLRRTMPRVDGTFSANPNCIFENPAAAKVVYDAVSLLEPQFVRQSPAASGHQATPQRRMGTNYRVEVGEVFSPDLWEHVKKHMGPEGMTAVRFTLLYPRLDEKVSTRRDHLLKLPFCIHPGTGRLCVPLEWDTIDDFDPQSDPPTIDQLLHESGAIDPVWLAPLQRIVQTLEARRSLKAEPSCKTESST